MESLDVARLSEWMQAEIPGFAGPIELTKFKGGQSNPTYLVETPKQRYVLRRRPSGTLLPSAHRVDREFQVISALALTNVPVPAAIAFCDDVSVIDSAFFIMEMIEGRTIWDGRMPDLQEAARADHWHAAVDVLADLHLVDQNAVGLQEFGRPGNYFVRQVDRWTKQYRYAETDENQAMERLIEYLPTTVPKQMRTSIVHGDYRIDNLKFASDDQVQVVALLDWELSTLGDPIADLTYMLLGWVDTASEIGALKSQEELAPGVPLLDSMLHRYCERAKIDTVENLDWYFAFNLFRTVSIAQGVKKRMLSGNASSDRASEVSALVPRLSSAALGFAKAAGA